MTRSDILEIIEENPRVTGAGIHRELQRRSCAARWFGEDSVLVDIFGPSIGRTYSLLWELEREGCLRSEWEAPRLGSKYRSRRYTVEPPK